MIRLYHQNLAYHLRRAAENARSVLIVTPYVKIRAIEAIIPRGIWFDELTLVTRGAPDDFASGISDLDALDAVWLLGGEVYRIPNLHAKYYRFDRIFFTGSANLTGRGIGVGLDQKWNDEVLASDFTSRESHELEHDWRMARYGFRGTPRENFGHLSKDGGARGSFRTGSAGGPRRKRGRSRLGGSPPALSRICSTTSSGGGISGISFLGIPMPVLSGNSRPRISRRSCRPRHSGRRKKWIFISGRGSPEARF